MDYDLIQRYLKRLQGEIDSDYETRFQFHMGISAKGARWFHVIKQVYREPYGDSSERFQEFGSYEKAIAFFKEFLETGPDET